MSGHLARKLTPEEVEVEKKRTEVAQLEAVLVERQLQLSTLQGELQAFEHKYVSTVGVLYAELDAIEAEIARKYVTTQFLAPV